MGNTENNTSANKLISCTSCGHQIAKSAKTCPSCGAKVKRPIFKKKLFWIVIVILAIFCAVIIKNVVANSGNGVSANGQSFSISEFKDMVNNNGNKFENEYVGTEVTVTGRVTKIESDYRSTNLNHYFSAVVVVEGTWYFEVSSQNPALKNLEIGDKVAATGVISTDLYSDVYCYGDSTIIKE